MVKNYSLADYDFTIRSINPDGTNTSDGFNFTLGGAGNFLGGVKVDFDGEIWSKDADVLGNVIYTKSYDRSGKITITLNMLAEKVKVFSKIIQLYYGGSIRNRNYADVKDIFFSITIKKHGSSYENLKPEVEATYCVLQGNPSIEFGESAGTRDFVFLAAEVGTPNVIEDALNGNGDSSYSYRDEYNVEGE